MPAAFPLSATLATRLLAAQCAQGRVVQRRREYYRRWLSVVQGVPGLTPLYPVLADDVAPYAFPLLIDSEGLLFHWFKLAGIPMWRWEDMAVSDCPVSLEYRWRLIQLPCHQELSVQEITWMISTVKDLTAVAMR